VRGCSGSSAHNMVVAAEHQLCYDEGKALEAVSQSPFVIASDRRERGNPTRRVVASPKGVVPMNRDFVAEFIPQICCAGLLAMTL
jgi:hypothetical protein